MGLDSFKDEDTSRRGRNNSYTDEDIIQSITQLVESGKSLTSKNINNCDDAPHTGTLKSRYGSVGNIIYKSGFAEAVDECSSCGNYYVKIGKHKSQSTCDYNSLTERDENIIKGIVLSDGHIARRNDNMYLDLTMKNERFLHWLSDQLSLVCRVKSKDKYYRLTTLSHPSMSKFNWMEDNNKKKFPDELSLNSTIVKMWYCGDGGLQWSKHSANGLASISCQAQIHREDYLVKLFDDIGLNPTINGPALLFSVGDTNKLLDIMGDPPPGFEYKWENSSREQYEKLK